ncbi:MAG: lysoplasmalogenase [Pseudomonadota bacterium]
MGWVYGLVCVLCVTVWMLIRAEFAGDDARKFIFKPLSTGILVVILLIILFSGTANRGYALGLLGGLLFCYGGDMALMFPRPAAFRVGLVLFLAGHVVYGAAFSHFSGIWLAENPATWGIVVLGIAIYAFLYPGLGNMKLSVLAYILVISFMVNSAFFTGSGEFFSHGQALLAGIGAVLFYVSDVILAVNRYRFPFRYNRISLGFYYAGQLFIVLSAA